ncbi:MAG: hypothetical protein WC196_02920 [Bacilli bacterium]
MNDEKDGIVDFFAALIVLVIMLLTVLRGMEYADKENLSGVIFMSVVLYVVAPRGKK